MLFFLSHILMANICFVFLGPPCCAVLDMTLRFHFPACLGAGFLLHLQPCLFPERLGASTGPQTLWSYSLLCYLLNVNELMFLKGVCGYQGDF